VGSLSAGGRRTGATFVIDSAGRVSTSPTATITMPTACPALEKIDDETPAEFAEGWVDYLHEAHEQYCPISFWDELDVFVQMTVEEIDLKTLFNPVCRRFHLPLSNVSGWNDINERAEIMRRFAAWAECGKQVVLLHCGDHDPGGLRISDFIRSNMADIKSVGWRPDNLIIERFGLNADFIRRNRLTWIDNLETGSGGDLSDADHPDHFKSYVQDYLQEFGSCKCEANSGEKADPSGLRREETVRTSLAHH
jgi:hypothetical protein